MTELGGWQYWNQLDDPNTADGRADENAVFNCANECIAMCVMYVHGVELPADYFHDRLSYEGYRGYFTIDQIVQGLGRWGGVQSQPFYEDAYDVAGRLCYAIDDGRPCVLLLRFNDNWESGHFVCVIGYDADNLYLADPYGGRRRVMPWNDLPDWYKSAGVEVLMHRHPEL